MEEWKLVFWLAFVISGIANVLYVVFMSAQIQPWNDLHASGNES